jgi:DNA-binding NarL/FixJ family response regulator
MSVPKRKPRVVLADDHTLLLEVFEKLLSPVCDIVGKVSDGLRLVEIAGELKPDVIVVDISIPLLNGLEAARRIKKEREEIKIVFLTQHEDPEFAVEAFRNGASAYLLKVSAASEVLQVIQTVTEGHTYVTPRVAKGMQEALVQGKFVKEEPSRELTVRQKEVLRLLAEGRSMKEAAEVLRVTARTIAFHKYSVMERFGLKTNADLFQFSIKHHLVSKP